MDILEGLNPEQLAAVNHVDGPLLVVAGAGTGKTQVITRRIAALIEGGHAGPMEVLALTFTEKAAREMADRLYDLVGGQAFQVPVMTFNAFGAELLGRYAHHIGRSIRGGLINSTQKSLLLKQHLTDIKYQYYGPQADPYGFVEQVVGYIERLQNTGITAASYRQFVDGLKPTETWHAQDIAEQQDLAALYDRYEQIKHDTGTYDYYDQLAIPLEVLRQRPNLAERLRQQYRYVLVDEYQDTSPVQDALLRLLVPAGGNIFAVGDDDQAIYGFRGADITNILSFSEHFKVKQAAALVQNYRSGQPILDAAYRLIRHNDPDRLEVQLGLNKQLKAQTNEGSVVYVPYQSPAEEQAGVVADVARRLDAGEPAASLAVLARSNALLRTYAKALRARQIPFSLSTSVNIFEQRELINLWYLLEWLGGRANDEAIAHVVMGPFMGWSAANYRVVALAAKEQLSSAEVILRNLADSDNEAARVVARLDEWRQWAAELPISQLAYRLVFETGLKDSLVAEGSSRVQRVFEDLHLLLSQMADYEVVATDTTLAGYLANFPKPPVLETTELLGEVEGVQLLTVHAAKGLEFDTVYVVNVTARSWAEQSGGTGPVIPAELLPAAKLPPEHEQRRLMYVAVTRAKTSLVVSAPAQSAGGQRQSVSPLLAELLGELPPPNTDAKPASLDQAVQRLERFYPLKADLPDRKLPFELADGWIELAVGALDSYRRCPHEFYLQHVLGISQPFGPQLAFGVALHGAIQAYYEARLRGEKPVLAELQARLDEQWSERGYESRALAEAALERAHKTLAKFVEREDKLARQVLGSELKVVLEIPEAKLRLRGRIDAYFQTPEGVEIRDFKTGTKRDAEKLAAEAKDNFQLRTYALAYEEMTGQVPSQVTLDYVVSGIEGSAGLTARVLANHRAKLAELANRIRARDFAPAPASDFHHCAAFTYYGDAETEEAPV